MQISWEQLYAQRTGRMKSSAIRELLKITRRPDMISFSGGLPAPEVFPAEKMARVAQHILRTDGAQALQYGPTEGYPPLRELIAQRMTQDGLRLTAENVLITTGSQQALDLLGKIFFDPGDTVLVESPTYMGALTSWNPYEVEYMTLPSDQHGLITANLDDALRAEPKCLYVLPTFQNPGGTTLPLERRRQLIAAINRRGVPVIEDDPYGQLRFEGEALPSLLLLDSQQQARNGGAYQGNIIYVGTFSKVLAPGLRVAWVVAPGEVIRKLVQAKQGADLHTASLNQMIVYELVREGFIEQHLPEMLRLYRERRDVMLEALARYFPPGASWTHPEGGLFLWVTLPEWMDATEVLRAAVERGVAFVPGASFHARGGGANTMRLNFSHSSPEKLREGVARLGQVLYEMSEKKVNS
ncbi:MAG TPA: PLP-dependent aminotransferase family protein [Ktedonobacteraceae bacterium]|nr:PLP-dependent aminotransferase family protein [Ktedonobacteraceae bacterium]